MTRDQAVRYYLAGVYGEFINWESGTCSFNSDEFIKILEYIGSLETEIEKEKAYLETVIKDEAVIYPVNINSLYYIMTYDVVFGDTEYSFKGIPTPNGKNGVVLYTRYAPALAITAACSDIDGAGASCV